MIFQKFKQRCGEAVSHTWKNEDETRILIFYPQIQESLLFAIQAALSPIHRPKILP